MKLVNNRCCNCGAPLEIDKEKKIGHCPYCDSRFELSLEDDAFEKKVEQVFQQISSKRFSSASKMADELLTSHPDCSDLCVAKLLCFYNKRDLGDLAVSGRTFTGNRYYQMAMEKLDETKKEELAKALGVALS